MKTILKISVLALTALILVPACGSKTDPDPVLVGQWDITRNQIRHFENEILVSDRIYNNAGSITFSADGTGSMNDNSAGASLPAGQTFTWLFKESWSYESEQAAVSIVYDATKPALEYGLLPQSENTIVMQMVVEGRQGGVDTWTSFVLEITRRR